ncbi:MAG: SpoIVB peptidase [Clostridiales bacterium]|nr:SpoIVB peptidase [Clostridiales bacterium]
MKVKYRSKIFLTAFLAACLMTQGSQAFAQKRQEFVPMGTAVGIQMFTDGALVVGLSGTENGAAPSPAALAGLLPGDLITELGGEKIESAADLKLAISSLKDETVEIKVLRKGEAVTLELCPYLGSGEAEIGLWLRDNVAGIGTLTFFDPQTGLYGGLGHGINDVDTGVLLPLGRGSILKSSITGIIKGCPGSPGELSGAFDTSGIWGSITMNTYCGIFGQLDGSVMPSAKAIPVANENEIELGEATILSNTSGEEVEEFRVEITRVYKGDNEGRSLMLCVKDEGLLERTGGIVQGMSGSPIIQNGMLIGAVTHVMVNDPSKGFGVSIENMMAAASRENTFIDSAA